MFVTDATGRLLVRVAPSIGINCSQGGIAWDGAAYLYTLVAGAANDPSKLGVRLSPEGYIRAVAAAGVQANAVDAWPLLPDGTLPLYLDIPVPATASYNGGVAMDSAGVYAVTVP